ncbi:MAG: hypothetical protein Q4A32_08700 [Lachnospiraceae bacterium]|nr:hypothetical protein [Lachnospiraceae bacterium]
MEAKFRHQQYILFYSGLAVILFGVWGVIKVIASQLIAPINWTAVITNTNPNADAEAVSIFFNIVGYSILGIVCLFEILSRLFIGLSAIRESRGHKRNVFYLVFTVLYFVLNFYSGVSSLIQMAKGSYDYNIDPISHESIITVIIDLTSQLSLFLVFTASCQARWLRQAIRKKRALEKAASNDDIEEGIRVGT